MPPDQDDPILQLRLHDSSIEAIVTLLRTLAELAAVGPEDRLVPDLRSYLTQALDTSADLDLLFGELATAVADARRHASGES